LISPGRWAVYFSPDRKCYTIEIDGHRHDLTRQEAVDIRQGLKVALGYGETYEPIPDTQPAPPMTPEPITKPATPIPIKRASGEHRLTLPHGIQAEVDAILEEGKGPPK